MLTRYHFRFAQVYKGAKFSTERNTETEHFYHAEADDHLTINIYVDFSFMPQESPILPMGSAMFNYMHPNAEVYQAPVSTPASTTSSPRSISTEFSNTSPSSTITASFSITDVPTSNPVSKKEKDPLPPIDKSELKDVVEKYHCFLKSSRLTRLAVKLAKEAYFWLKNHGKMHGPWGRG